MKMNIPRKSYECLEHQYNTTSSQSFVVLLSGRVHNSCFHSAGKHWQAKYLENQGMAAEFGVLIYGNKIGAKEF